MFTALQRGFAAAVIDPSSAVPEDISACHGEGAARRFNIYRNNVAVGLLDALAARFPVTQQIVGETFFRQMARCFVAAHPPASPLMMFYGDSFPDFIASFEAGRDIAYLIDVARLEAARTRAYHAQDATPLAPAVLQSVAADDLGHMRFLLHPSVEIVSSPHPIVTILAMNEGSIALGPIADWQGEDALVARPFLDVEIRALPPGGALFLRSLGKRQGVGEAAMCALASDENFDLAVNLAGLFSAELVTAYSIVSPKDLPR